MNRTRPSRRAFTLIEMVVACAITAIIAVAMGSIVMLASRVMPQAKAVTFAQNEAVAARALELMSADLSQASSILSLSSNAIQVNVPDRDGDGTAEKIVYSWSGTANTPLQRSINNGSGINVIDKVSSFMLTPSTIVTTLTVNDAPVTSAETLLASYTGAAGTTQTVSSSVWPIVTFPVTLPTGTTSYTVTRVDLNISRTGLLVGADTLQLRTAWPDGLPSSTKVATVAMPGGILALGLGWQSYTPVYSGSSVLNARRLSLVLTHDSGSAVLKVATTTSAVTGMRSGKSTDSGATWTMGDGAWNFRVYGKVVSVPTHAATTIRVKTVAVDVTPAGAGTTMRTTVRFLSEPIAP